MRKGSTDVVLVIGGFLIVVFLAIGGCWGVPQYRVYTQRLEGEAMLQHAISEKQVQIEDAKGKHEAAKLLAETEVERAKGVAEANRIIGDSLNGNDAYLRYLWIEKLGSNGQDVIYIPTEAGLPILEAGRKHKD